MMGFTLRDLTVYQMTIFLNQPNRKYLPTIIKMWYNRNEESCFLNDRRQLEERRKCWLPVVEYTGGKGKKCW